MTEPLVSIVVPTYNRAGYIETAILSLLHQDYRALEVIVVDDGSQDATRAILERIAERFPSDRFRWMSHANQGQAFSINQGFDAARGELLGYLSSDDFFASDAIASLVRAAAEHADADVFYPSYVIVDEADQVIDTIRPLRHTLTDAVRWSLCMPGLAVLVRRSFLERTGGWDPEFKFIPDFEWFMRDPTTTFVRVPQLAGGWRFHAGSITVGDWSISNVRARFAERLDMLDKVFAHDDLPEEVLAVQREAYSSVFIEMGLLCDAGAVDRRPRRYVVDDTLGRLFSNRAAWAVEQNYRWSDRLRARAEHRANAVETENAALEETIRTLQAAAVERAAVNEFLRRELGRVGERHAAAPPPESRSVGLRIARALTPSPWRSRLGAIWYRLRTMAPR